MFISVSFSSFKGSRLWALDLKLLDDVEREDIGVCKVEVRRGLPWQSSKDDGVNGSLHEIMHVEFTSNVNVH